MDIQYREPVYVVLSCANNLDILDILLGYIEIKLIFICIRCKQSAVMSATERF